MKRATTILTRTGGRRGRIVTAGGHPPSWQDIAVLDLRVILWYAPTEIECPTHGRAQEEIPWAAAFSRITYRSEWRICRLCQSMTGAAIALSRHCARSEGKAPFSRHQALRCASSIAAVALTASRCASARHRSNVATDTPISRDTWETSALSGGSSRAAARSLNSLLHRATIVPRCPHDYRGIEANTTVIQGDGSRVQQWINHEYPRIRAALLTDHDLRDQPERGSALHGRRK